MSNYTTKADVLRELTTVHATMNNAINRVECCNDNLSLYEVSMHDLEYTCRQLQIIHEFLIDDLWVHDKLKPTEQILVFLFFERCYYQNSYRLWCESVERLKESYSEVALYDDSDEAMQVLKTRLTFIKFLAMEYGNILSRIKRHYTM